MRNTFANEVTALAREDPRIILLSGDIGNKLFDDFKEIAPDRFYNCGVAEANMTGVAAGLAMMGFRSITYTITPFATVRCLEQIRVDVCYHNVSVIIVGTGAGLSYASLGPTHHSCDDIGFLRTIPNLTILCPCDTIEVRAALRAAVNRGGPTYLRLGKKGEPTIHLKNPDFQIGKAITVKYGTDCCILSTGNIMPVALTVAKILEEKNISTRIESFHTVKPLDLLKLTELFDQYSLIVTLEEHNLIGGLGSAVAEWITSQEKVMGKLLRFGTRDEFLPFVGEQEYARHYYGLDSQAITVEILKRLTRT